MSQGNCFRKSVVMMHKEQMRPHIAFLLLLLVSPSNSISFGSVISTVVGKARTTVASVSEKVFTFVQQNPGKLKIGFGITFAALTAYAWMKACPECIALKNNIKDLTDRANKITNQQDSSGGKLPPLSDEDLIQFRTKFIATYNMVKRIKLEPESSEDRWKAIAVTNLYLLKVGISAIPYILPPLIGNIPGKPHPLIDYIQSAFLQPFVDELAGNVDHMRELLDTTRKEHTANLEVVCTLLKSTQIMEGSLYEECEKLQGDQGCN
jgi:hypothetical protein